MPCLPLSLDLQMADARRGGNAVSAFTSNASRCNETIFFPVFPCHYSESRFSVGERAKSFRAKKFVTTLYRPVNLSVAAQRAIPAS